MKDALERVKAAAKRLKVFPLPSAVLLPGGIMPLHIFEPRYRAMVKDAMGSDAVFAMAQVASGQEHQLSGQPALEPMLCAGVVTVHEALEDGRSNLVLTGVCRARIVSEWPQTRAWREVEAEVLPDAAYEGQEEAALRSALFELMARVPAEVGQRIAQVTTGARGGGLADIVVGSLVADPERRFDVLRELDVPARLSLVTSELLELVSRLKPPRKPEGTLLN